MQRDRRTGVYFVRFRAHGRRRNLTTGTADPREAQARAAAIYAEDLSGRRRAPTSVTRTPLEELLTAWLASASAEVDETTADTWERYAAVFFVPFFRDTVHLTEATIADYARQRLRKVRATTVRKELSALRSFLSWCVEQGHMAEAPAVRSIPKRATGTPAAEQRRIDLTPELAEAIIAALPERTAKGNRARAFYAFMWETGLRRSTLWALRAPDDYQPGRQTLRIRKEADKSRYERELPLSPAARQVLDAVCPEVGAIFPRVDYRGTLRVAAEAAGLSEDDAKHVSAHDFRHAMLTHLGGMPATNLLGMAYLAGHKHVSTTAVYMHAAQEAAERALAAREAFGTPSGTRGRSKKRRPK